MLGQLVEKLLEQDWIIIAEIVDAGQTTALDRDFHARPEVR
jgi:hypothetical protein